MASYHLYFGATWAQLAVLIKGSILLHLGFSWFVFHYSGLNKKHAQAHTRMNSQERQLCISLPVG